MCDMCSLYLNRKSVVGHFVNLEQLGRWGTGVKGEMRSVRKASASVEFCLLRGLNSGIERLKALVNSIQKTKPFSYLSLLISTIFRIQVVSMVT